MVNLTETEVVSALGFRWQPSADSFRFAIKTWISPQHLTKRTLLSDINSIYDPLGLIAAVLIKGKIFIQQIWSLKVGWDDTLPKELHSKWSKFYASLAGLDALIIPRLVIVPKSNYEIHGFCDASQHAFGACIYLRSCMPDGHACARLYTSRSRVTPMKATTIPRLELCGALLLAELVTKVQGELAKLNIILHQDNVHLWTDSTIVIAWISTLVPLQVFVSNRVARINELTAHVQWHHTPTADNPADLVSRGIDVCALPFCKL